MELMGASSEEHEPGRTRRCLLLWRIIPDKQGDTPAVIIQAATMGRATACLCTTGGPGYRRGEVLSVAMTKRLMWRQTKAGLGSDI